MRKFLPMLAALSSALVAMPAAGEIPSVTVEGPIASDAKSRPWNASIDRIDPLDVDRLGYTEEEYLISGRANAYDWGAGEVPVVKAQGADYVTRILVRKPSDPARFSGTVWFNPSNPTLGIDMDGLWGCCSTVLARRGDIVVNITFKPVSMRSLKAVNPERYGQLAMPNPVEASLRCDTDAIARLESSMHYISDQEDGLAWDMFAQVGNLLKSGAASSPLSGFAVTRLYGYGYSQDANYLRTYINDFHNNAQRLYDAKDPFDGFLLVGGTRTVPINQCSTRSANTKARSFSVPVITASTEADANPALPGIPDGRSAWRPDSDAADDRYRHYDMAGTVHVGTAVYRTMPRPGVTGDLASSAPIAAGAIAQVAAKAGDEPAIPEIQQYHFLTAMMANLDDWSRAGRVPPAGARFDVDAAGNIRLDANGNAASGLRGPDITVPIATFALRGPASLPLGFLNYSYIPFSEAKLRELYPSQGRYVAKVKAAVRKLVRAGLIEEDAARELIETAQRRELPTGKP